MGEAMYNKHGARALLYGALTIMTVVDLRASSKSIFIPRSITTDSVYELALTQYDRYHAAEEFNYHLYVKPFFMQSTKDQLASYFLPNGKCCITMKEDGTGDVNSLWFNLIAPTGESYSSTVCLNPVRKAYGAVLSFYAHFCNNWWLGINSAAMRVNHNLHVCESNRTADGTCAGFKNACDGFNNPTWSAGKLPCCQQTRGGLDDIQCKLGYDYYTDDDRYSSLYLVATAPTGKKCVTNNVFEPLVGSRHGSFGVGLNGGTDWNLCDGDTVNLMLDVKYRYVFKAREKRSFDLSKNGDWSRYLLVVPSTQVLNSQPGVNVVTLPVQVTPGSTVDLWLGLHYQHRAWNFEVGYDFWYRQAEKICAPCSIAPHFGIQTLALCGDTLTSASAATISQGAAGSNATVTDATFTAITMTDLNVNSGAQPRSLSSTIYGDIGYTAERDCYSLLFGLGASYEFGTKNALRQWGIWYTQGVSF